MNLTRAVFRRESLDPFLETEGLMEMDIPPNVLSRQYAGDLLRLSTSRAHSTMSMCSPAFLGEKR